jgi:hypothetical protein
MKHVDKNKQGDRNNQHWQTQTMANGLSHHSQGQRPWNANRNPTFGQRPYSMHHAPGGLNMAVGQKCVLGFITRGVAPGYDDYGLWPKMQI